MKQYLDLIDQVERRGVWKGNRTGTRSLSMFGAQQVFDLRLGFPLLTTKHTSFKNIAVELLWFLQGNPNVDYLHEHNVHIWDEWVKLDETFGPIYGTQWRTWLDTKFVELASSDEGLARRQKLAKMGYIEDVNDPVADSVAMTRMIDQIANVIERLKTDPDNRRLIVSAWNVGDVESGEMALPPCHSFFQFWTRELSVTERQLWLAEHEPEIAREFGRKIGYGITHGHLDGADVPRRGLSCQLYQRSADLFLGVPYNIASYALLTHMIGLLVNMQPLEFVWTGGDVHLYENHMDQVVELKFRNSFPLPKLIIKRQVEHIDDFKLEDLDVVNYRSHSALKAPVAV
jgi:thymidylate synthase